MLNRANVEIERKRYTARMVSLVVFFRRGCFRFAHRALFGSQRGVIASAIQEPIENEC